MSALTNNQKQRLALLAQRAFRRAGAIARGRGLTPAAMDGAESLQDALTLLVLHGTPDAEKEWRHAHVRQAVAKDGLRCCSQLDYKAVEAHFLELLGQSGQALSAHVRHSTEPKRQARAVLDEALRRWEFHLSYAQNLCRKIHKVELDDAPANILWKLIYTINNRGKAKERKAEPTV